MNDIDLAVKFPFLDVARRTLKTKDVKINDLIIDKAIERINNALKGEIPKPTLIYDEDKIIEIASYPTARMILTALDNSFIYNRYAVAEAKRAHKYLESLPKELCKKIGSEMGLKIHELENKDSYKIDVVSYLKFAPKSVDYKLINKILIDGYVIISWHEYLRLIEEAIRYHILSNVKMYKKDMPDAIQNAIKRIKIPASALPKTINQTGYPPCISALIKQIQKHENLGHQARWVLAVYLTNIGLNDEQIINIYSGLPDFNYKITKYQVDHIRKRKYKMPSCSTMRTYGLCTANCGITNPLKWRSK